MKFYHLNLQQASFSCIDILTFWTSSEVDKDYIICHSAHYERVPDQVGHMIVNSEDVTSPGLDNLLANNTI